MQVLVPVTACWAGAQRRHCQSHMWGELICFVGPAAQDPQAPLSLLFPGRSQQGPALRGGVLTSALGCVPALENPSPCLIKPLGVGIHGNYGTRIPNTDEYLFN